MYKPNKIGKEYDLAKTAFKNRGRDCDGYKQDSYCGRCEFSDRCNWKEQEYTPIRHYTFPRGKASCCGIKIKKEELE